MENKEELSVIKQLIDNKQEKWKNYIVFKEDEKEIITSLMVEIAQYKQKEFIKLLEDRVSQLTDYKSKAISKVAQDEYKYGIYLLTNLLTKYQAL